MLRNFYPFTSDFKAFYENKLRIPKITMKAVSKITMHERSIGGELETS